MIEELLEVFMQGAQAPAQSASQRQPASPWMDLLDDVLGAGGQQKAPTPQAGVASLGMDDILGMVLGGGRQGAVGGNPLLAPFTSALADKLGISPQMASVIVSAAFGMLMSKLGGQGGATSGGNLGSMANGLDLDDLLDGDFLKKNGVTEKVAKQTGMDADEAQQSLLDALELLGLKKGTKVQPASQQKAAAPSPQKSAPPKSITKKSTAQKGDLKNLLDDWQVHG